MSKWIPVGVRLPEHAQKVRLLTTNGVEAEGEFWCSAGYTRKKWIVKDLPVGFYFPDITHWQPLPPEQST